MKQVSLGRKLRVLRGERGLSMRSAAERCGVTKETLSALERGTREPHDPTLAKIARGYGVPFEELLEEPVLAGKAEASATGQSEEDRLNTLEGYKTSILALAEKLGREFAELQDAGDRKSLLALYTEVAWTGLGIISNLEYANVTQGDADESEAERQARDGVRRALARLEDLSEDIEAALDALKENSAAFYSLAAYRRRKRAS